MHNLAWNGTECFVVSISNCDDDITSPISVCLFMLPLFCLAIQVQLVNMITVIIWEGGSGLLIESYFLGSLIPMVINGKLITISF